MKRFTDTRKFFDEWFQSLSQAHKLAWLYLLDDCDAAGVVDLNARLASFLIGEEVDWDAFCMASDQRVVRLESGKLFLTGFIEFQYGRLSRECKAHAPVFASLEKHFSNRDVPQRVSKGYPKGIHTLKEKDKEKDKDSGIRNKEDATAEAAAAPTPESDLPPALESAVAAWVAYKAERREAYKPRGLAALRSRIANLAAQHGDRAVIAAIERAQANGWKGFDHDVGAVSPRGSPVVRSPSDPRGTFAAAQRFLDGG